MKMWTKLWMGIGAFTIVHSNPALLLSEAPSLSSSAFAQAKDAAKKDGHVTHKKDGGGGGESGHAQHHTGDLTTDDVAF